MGQDMIKSAEIKAQVRQIEEHNQALAAFTLKYNYLPGDCGDICDTNSFGLVDYTVRTNDQQNGKLDGGWGGGNTPSMVCVSNYITTRTASFYDMDNEENKSCPIYVTASF